MCHAVGGEPLGSPAALVPPPQPLMHPRRARRETIRTSLRASVKDAIAFSVMNGAGERYVAPFVILGGSTLWQLAAITALPLLGGAIVQQIAANVTDSLGRRKHVYLAAAIGQALLWIPFSIAIFLPATPSYWLMLAAYVLMTIGHNISLPAWFSTMGDLVPTSRRGRYFGFRNFLSGWVVIAAFLGGGAWLTASDGLPGLPAWGLSGRECGFLTLFVIAGIARAVSAYYLDRMTEPPYVAPREDRFTFRQFLRRMPQGQFGRFVIYRAGVQAGQIILLTYVSWYMLDQLHLSPLVYAWIMTANLAATYATQPYWGRLADRLGNKHVLALGGIAAAATPVLLLFSDNPWYYGAVLLYDGITVSAIGMAGSNYLLDIVTPSKRARCIAFGNVFTGLGSVLGAFAGVLVATATPYVAPLWQSTLGGDGPHPFVLILLATVVLRVLPNVTLLPTFHEARLGLPKAARR